MEGGNQIVVSKDDGLGKAVNAVDMAINSGVPRNMLADVLSSAGWEPNLINQAINIWLQQHPENVQQTDMKMWLKSIRRAPFQRLALWLPWA